MDNEYIQALRKEVKKEFTADKARYWHTIGVAETSACLAMRYGVDMQKAFTAGLLHDCAKCYSDEQLIEICESNNIEITQAERMSPYLLHAKAGAFFAGTKYGIDDEDICNAIRYHSTGHPGMTPLEEIVFIADYMEPLRNKADNLDEIRALVFKDIKEAIYRVTLSTIEYLKKRNKPIEPRPNLKTRAFVIKISSYSPTRLPVKIPRESFLPTDPLARVTIPHFQSLLQLKPITSTRLSLVNESNSLQT